MRRPSLGTRWAIRFGVVSVLTLLALFVFVERRVERLVRSDAEEMLEVLLEHTRLHEGETPEQRRVRLEADLDLVEPDDKVAFVLFDAEGRAMLSLGHDESRKAPPPPADLPVGDADFGEVQLGSKYPYWTMARREADGSSAQVVIYGRGFVRRGDRIEYSFLSTLPFAALGFAALGVVMARSVLGPVRRMVESIESMGARRLDARLPVSGRGDELDRIAEAFNRLMARLQQSFETLRGFTGDVAHQLRSPLTGARSRIEVALHEESLPPRATEVLEGLHGDVLRLSEIVDTMLRLARYTAGLDARQRQRVDLAAVVGEVAEFLGPLAAEREVQLRVQAPAGAEVLGDASWLRQLLVNLAENALDHTPEGGQIALEVQVLETLVQVCVIDSGPGIPEAQRPRVFERFFRTTSSSGRQGLGLGLAIAREIAEVHDGSLDVAPRPGGGTSFRLRLPLAPAAPTRTAQSPRGRVTAPSASY